MTAKWYDREHWYRIPEREGVLTPAPLREGTLIRFQRVIVRCGYYYGYKDAPLKELNRIAIDSLSARTGHTENECLRIVQCMEVGGYDGVFNWSRKYRCLVGMYYDARRTWVSRQEPYANTLNKLRTFWYVDVPSKDDPWFKYEARWDSSIRSIKSRELRMIGTPDVEYEHDEYGSSYCVGTYFNEHGRQTLYGISPMINRIVLATDRDRRWYVHPLDAVVVD